MISQKEKNKKYHIQEYHIYTRSSGMVTQKFAKVFFIFLKVFPLRPGSFNFLLVYKHSSKVKVITTFQDKNTF